MADITRDQVIDFLGNLTVLEISELTKELEKRWGVSAAPVAVAGAVAAGAAAPAVAEEPTEFNVILTSAGEKKIQVIKAVRVITGLGLKEAKALVEGAPQPLKDGVNKAESEEIKKQVEAEGGQVEIKPVV